MFKMFLQISGLENTAYVKGWYGDLAITIKDVLFNLDWWLGILIRHMNTLVKTLQISSDWHEILDPLHPHTTLNYTRNY